MEININNSSYNIQRVFTGQHAVPDLIKSRLCTDFPRIFPLTNQTAIPYNTPIDCSVVRRHNG